jgi:hypothetical protein
VRRQQPSGGRGGGRVAYRLPTVSAQLPQTVQQLQANCKHAGWQWQERGSMLHDKVVQCRRGEGKLG